MAETETDDDLHAAITKILSEAQQATDSDGQGQTKSAILGQHRDEIKALREKNERYWTWDRIAGRLGAAGLKVSARTVRLEMAKGQPGPKKGARTSANGRTSRLGVAKRPALTGGTVASLTAETEEAQVTKQPTGDGFYKAEEVDN